MENIGQQKYIQFESLICKIFETYNYEVTRSYNMNRPIHDYDLLARKGNSELAIEVKYSKMRIMRSDMIYSAAFRLKDIPPDMQPIIVFSGLVNNEVREKVASLGRINLIDINNLLYLVDGFPDLKEELLSLLEFSTTDVIPNKPEHSLFDVLDNRSDVSEDSDKTDSLISELKNWDSKNRESKEYETICTKALKQLFADELGLWSEQTVSNDALYRFDLICKIKDDVENGLWRFLQRFFNTKYVIFEFKNYTEQISQKEIYTTEKYLYSKALRGVAIIISCKGENSNAQKAIRGILRETGKLILSINNDNLITMLNLKENNDIPSDHLYTMIDDMLVDLEK